MKKHLAHQFQERTEADGCNVDLSAGTPHQALLVPAHRAQEHSRAFWT